VLSGRVEVVCEGSVKDVAEGVEVGRSGLREGGGGARGAVRRVPSETLS
jgi:hypothetical protein